MPRKTKLYYLCVLGCQMNWSDALKLEKILSDLRYQKTDNEAKADLIAVVACSVRQSATDRVYGRAKNWQRKRKAKRLKTILTGCVLDHDKEKMSALFDFVIDVKNIADLKYLLAEKTAKKSLKDYLCLPSKQELKFKASIPIMTGCNNFCSYCVVPYVRGREKSRPASQIIKECKSLVESGCKEIMLLGQNVNSYKSGKYDFPQLLKAIDKIKGDYWLRFVTSHPKDLSESLIDALKNGKHITPYLHLALQSGDDDILKAMNRKYSSAKFLNIVKKARLALPDAMISTDVIVGFPGEGKKQFANTIKLFKEANFDMGYISKYSPRKGTAAYQLKDNVSKDEKDNRKTIINELLKKSALANNQKYIGRQIRVLVEKFNNGKCFGKSRNYKTVAFAGDKEMVGQFVEVVINRADCWGLFN